MAIWLQRVAPPPQEVAPRTCTEPVKRTLNGRNAGDPCGQPCITGSDKCSSHDPERMAARTARRVSGEKPKCHAHSTRTGEPCKRAPVDGLEVCYMHGGGTAAARRKGAERAAEEKARKMLARMDIQPVGNALEALQQVAGEVIAFKDACSDVMNTLKTTDWRYPSSQKLEQVRGEVVLYQTQLDKVVVTLSALARAQVDERLVKIEETRLQLIVNAMTGALADAGLDAGTANVVRVDFARRLREIGAPKAPRRRTRASKTA